MSLCQRPSLPALHWAPQCPLTAWGPKGITTQPHCGASVGVLGPKTGPKFAGGGSMRRPGKGVEVSSVLEHQPGEGLELESEHGRL